MQDGVYDIEKFSTLLEDKLGAHEDVFDERRPIGQARLFDLTFDEDGYPLAQSFVLSLACWAAGQILHYHNGIAVRSEEHTSELQSLMRISYAVFCLKKKKKRMHTKKH